MTKDKHSTQNLDERSQKLLKLLVERYILEGEPVSSGKLAAEQSIALSSATVRNIMQDLEQAGFLHSPHTSAGRVPTPQGYRFFIDSLLRCNPVTEEELSQLKKQIAPDMSTKGLLQSTSKLLSQVTHLTGIITFPKHRQRQLKHIELLPLSEHRVLAILVLNERDVENRIIYTDQAYSKELLKKASEFFNTYFTDKPFDDELKRALLASMKQDRADMDAILRATIQVAEQTVAAKEQQDHYFIEGEGHLLKLVKEQDLARVHSLFDIFSEKQAMMGLLDQCLKAEGIRIFIGEESLHPALVDCSVVTAPYKVDGLVVGVLGVIGPTRMSYDKVIPVVDVTARLLSAALKEED